MREFDDRTKFQLACWTFCAVMFGVMFLFDGGWLRLVVTVLFALNIAICWHNAPKKGEKKSMVKHIVLYTFKEGVDKDASVALIASLLEPLVGKIPGLQHLEIRRAYNGVDYALYSEFASRQALSDYAVHPLHLEAKKQFFHLLDQRFAADYDV